MADYKKMYLELFNSSQKVIDELKAAQIRAEEIYLSSPAEPILFPTGTEKADEKK